jgi:hypothetical protein
MAKYDSVLQNHISKLQRKSHYSTGTGRGSFITFFSKTILSKIMIIIANCIKQQLTKQVNEAGRFSIQMDSTQDVSVTDQLAIVLRYVREGVVHEHLYRLISVNSSSGENLFNIMRDSLTQDDLKVER